MAQPTKKSCSIDGCENPLSARGWCSTHYTRWQKYGDPHKLLRGIRPQFCSIDGCDGKRISFAWCGKHYARWRRHGDPEVMLTYRGDPDGYFKAHVEWQGDCLMWTGYIDRGGYGTLSKTGGTTLAHRYAWMRVHGDIPEGMLIDHTCHNRACMNIKHLRLATNQQNLSHRSYKRRIASSGYRNVYREGNGWRVAITKKGESLKFGTYSTIEEAAEVAAQARRELFGEFAGRG